MERVVHEEHSKETLLRLALEMDSPDEAVRDLLHELSSNHDMLVVSSQKLNDQQRQALVRIGGPQISFMDEPTTSIPESFAVPGPTDSDVFYDELLHGPSCDVARVTALLDANPNLASSKIQLPETLSGPSVRYWPHHPPPPPYPPPGASSSSNRSDSQLPLVLALLQRAPIPVLEKLLDALPEAARTEIPAQVALRALAQLQEQSGPRAPKFRLANPTCSIQGPGPSLLLHASGFDLSSAQKWPDKGGQRSGEEPWSFQEIPRSVSTSTFKYAVMAGAPARLLQKFVMYDPQAATVRLTPQMPFLHFLITNRESFQATGWLELALTVLNADENVAQVQNADGLSPLRLAFEHCDMQHVQFLVSLAESDGQGFQELCRELDIDVWKKTTDTAVQAVLQLKTTVQTCFRELKMGGWADACVVLTLLQDMPGIAKLRVVGEYLLWWAVFFVAPLEIAQALLSAYPSAASAENRSVPILHLAILNGYGCTLIVELLKVYPEAFDAKINVTHLGRASCRFNPQDMEASVSNCLHMALTARSDEELINLLLDHKSLTGSADPRAVSVHPCQINVRDSLFILALKFEKLTKSMLQKVISSLERSWTDLLFAISEDSELRKQIPKKNLSLLASLMSNSDLESARAAVAMQALRDELDKNERAQPAKIKQILCQHGDTLARSPMQLRHARSGEYLLPVWRALISSAPAPVVHVLLNAYPEAVHTCPSQRAHGYHYQHVSQASMLCSVLSRMKRCSSTLEISEWMRLAKDVFDLAPRALNHEPDEHHTSLAPYHDQSEEDNPLKLMLDMERSLLNRSVLLFGHIVAHAPHYLEAWKGGRNLVQYAISRGAPVEIVRKMLVHAAPSLICSLDDEETDSVGGKGKGKDGRVSGSPKGKGGPLRPTVNLFKDLLGRWDDACRFSYTLPEPDWVRERLVWIARLKSPSLQSGLGALPIVAITKICACFGNRSVALLLLQGCAERVTVAEAKTAVQQLLGDVNRDFDVHLLRKLVNMYPQIADMAIRMSSGDPAVSFKMCQSKVTRNSTWECSLLEAIILKRLTCPIDVACSVAKLYPQAARVQDHWGRIPLTYALLLPMTWNRVRMLIEILLSESLSSESIMPDANKKLEDFVKGCKVSVEGHGEATIISKGPVPAHASRHAGLFKVRYNDGSTYHVPLENLTLLKPHTENKPDLPVLLVALQNPQVPPARILNIMEYHPKDISLRLAPHGETALELALRRVDGAELVAPILQACPQLAFMPLSPKAYTEVGKQSWLPAALALHLRVAPEMFHLILLANSDLLLISDDEQHDFESVSEGDKKEEVLMELLNPRNQHDDLRLAHHMAAEANLHAMMVAAHGYYDPYDHEDHLGVSFYGSDGSDH